MTPVYRNVPFRGFISNITWFGAYIYIYKMMRVHPNLLFMIGGGRRKQQIRWTLWCRRYWIKYVVCLRCFFALYHSKSPLKPPFGRILFFSNHQASKSKKCRPSISMPLKFLDGLDAGILREFGEGCQFHCCLVALIDKEWFKGWL